MMESNIVVIQENSSLLNSKVTTIFTKARHWILVQSNSRLFYVPFSKPIFLIIILMSSFHLLRVLTNCCFPKLYSTKFM